MAAVFLAALATTGALLHVGCASRSAPERVGTAPPANTAPTADSPPATPPAPEEPAGLALRPLDAPTFTPANFRIVSPAPGQLVPIQGASELEVTLEGPSEGMLLALEGHAFRRLQGNRAAVGRLLLEDEEVAPGPHRLVAVRDEGGRRSVAATWFWVHEGEPRAAEAPDEPPGAGVVLLAPRGTFNGEQAADAVRIDAFALAPFGGAGGTDPVDAGVTLRARVVGPDGSATRETRGEPLAVLGLGSGDHRVEVGRAAPADGGSPVSAGPWAVATRVITVNREASPPEDR